MEVITLLSESFWDEGFWLPANVTWENMRSTEEVKYPDFNDLIIPFMLAAILLAVGCAVERYVWAPIGRLRGLTTRTRPVAFNEVLETSYQNKHRISHEEVRQLASQLCMTERQVDRWLRLRKLQDTPSKLTRFCEIAWPFTYYICSFSFALFTLRDKPWFWDIKLCYFGLPFHELDDGVWRLYMLSMAYTWSMTVRHCTDHRRKDFWPMLLHHFLTIFLLTFSWTCNLVRSGSLTLILHDIADIFLMGSKMLHYLGLQRACTVTFLIFTVIWIVTRLFIFPGWLVYGLYVLGEPPSVNLMPVGLPIVSRPLHPSRGPWRQVEPFPAQSLFLAMTLLLVALHCMWTYYLLAMLFSSLRSGQMKGDTRSESSEEVSSGNADASPQVSPSSRSKLERLSSGDSSDNATAAAAGGDNGNAPLRAGPVQAGGTAGVASHD